MGGRCQSVSCKKSSKLHCSEIDEGKREEIFKYFWGKLEWKERRMYVKTSVEVSDVKRRRTEAVQSRRSASLFCCLCVDDKRLRVCQRMFLSTLGIKQWTFLKWVGRRGESPEKMVRVSVRTEEQDFLKTFLLDLPKVRTTAGPPHQRCTWSLSSSPSVISTHSISNHVQTTTSSLCHGKYSLTPSTI